MLGFLFVVVGALFIVVGMNGAFGGSAAPDGRPRHPIPGGQIRSGSGAASPGGRRAVGIGWMVLGVIFIVAAFTHNVP